MESEPNTEREKLLLLLRATLIPAWLPKSGFRRLVWVIRIGILLGVLAYISSFYDVTLWDWLKLLIVPAVIAGGGLWFNRQQQERQREDNRQQQERGLEIEKQRAQDEALQAYLDQMSQLMLEGGLRGSEQRSEEVRTLARARTRTVLARLEGARKGSVVRFLFEAKLITKAPADGVVLDLREADLSGADLREATLTSANLSGADLRKANLSGAKVAWAELKDANLTGADLRSAVLYRTDLSRADLSGVDLSRADLKEAYKKRIDEASAQLITTKELERQAKSLKGAIMPNGHRYED